MVVRQKLYNFIEERLIVLARRVEVRGKLNILDLHLHSENFYRDFLNVLYGWNLENLNKSSQNVEAIDLIDRGSHIVIQVSSTNTKHKIEESLSKAGMAEYTGWKFKFVSIAKSAEILRNKEFSNPHGLSFEPSCDILDVESILREVLNLMTDDLIKVYNFIKDELGDDRAANAIESDLVRVIKMLSQVDAIEFDGVRLDNEFEVEEKIKFNSLESSYDVVKEYRVWQAAIGRVYNSFAAEGMNKSYFVLQKIRSFYVKHRRLLTGDALFDAVRTDVKNEILKNASGGELSREALDICADIIVVDAFIRCRIFENPEGYRDVTA